MIKTKLAINQKTNKEHNKEREIASHKNLVTKR